MLSFCSNIWKLFQYLKIRLYVLHLKSRTNHFGHVSTTSFTFNIPTITVKKFRYDILVSENEKH